MPHALPQPALRPFLPQDAQILAQIFRDSIAELTGEDYDEAQQAAWIACADDEEAFARRLAEQLTLIVTIGGSPVGFISVKGQDHIDMLYVHPSMARSGIGTVLCDAIEKLARSRGARHLSVDASDTARPFFEKRGFFALHRQTVPCGDEWLGNTHMEKRLQAEDQRGLPNEPRQSLPLRHDVARRRADDRRRFFDRRQKAHRRLLDGLGIDYIEGGYPGANPIDTEFFAKKPKLRTARFTAFGMTKRAGRSAANDPGIAALLDADADAITFVAKSWDYHVHVALGCTLDENLDGISQSIEAACAKGREAMLDCEHFFDGYKANPDYALACAKAAYDVRRALDRALRHQWRHAAA